jgi:hypothetical protein
MQFPSNKLPPTISLNLVGSNQSSPSSYNPVSNYLSSYKIQPYSTKSGAAFPAQSFDNLHSYRSNEISNLLKSTELNRPIEYKNCLNVKPLDNNDPKRRFSAQPPSIGGFSFSSFDENGSPPLRYQSINILNELSVTRNDGNKLGTTQLNTYLPTNMLSGYSPTTYNPTTYSPTTFNLTGYSPIAYSPQTSSPTTSLPYINSIDLSSFNLKIEPVISQLSSTNKYELTFLTSLAKKFKESTHKNNEEIAKGASSAKKPENMFMEERSPLRKLNLYGIEKDLIGKVDQIHGNFKKLY